MKILKIYKQDNDFVMEHNNQFNHSFKSYFDSDIQVLGSLHDFAENGEDYRVEIRLDDKNSREMLEVYCNRTINLRADTWKNNKINHKKNEVELER